MDEITKLRKLKQLRKELSMIDEYTFIMTKGTIDSVFDSCKQIINQEEQ